MAALPKSRDVDRPVWQNGLGGTDRAPPEGSQPFEPAGDDFSSIEAGRDGLARLLDGSPGLDAVYFSNDDMAVGGLFHCRARDRHSRSTCHHGL